MHASPKQREELYYMRNRVVLIVILAAAAIGAGAYFLRGPLGISPLEEPILQINLRDYQKVPAPKHESPFYIVKAENFTKLSESPVWVAVFFDYFCPHCQSADKAILELANDKRFKGKISVAAYLFPLNNDCNFIVEAARKERAAANNWPSVSCDLSYFAAASGDQFPAVSQDFFDKAKRKFDFNETSIARLAESYGIKDYKKNPKSEAILKQMLSAAEEYKDVEVAPGRKGITSTPTLVVNGYLVVGLPNLLEKETLESIFFQVLKEKEKK